MADHEENGVVLPKKWADLPWKRINWCLHIVWAVAILLLLNSCGNARDLDSLSISLTILEIVVVVALIGGFWLLRPEVRETTETEARAVAEKLVGKYVNDVLPEQVRTHVENLIPLQGDANDSYGSETEPESQRGDTG